MVTQATELAKEQPAVSTEIHPTHEDIAALAYALWRERGYPEGTHEDDWCRAEQELVSSRDAAVHTMRS